MSASMTKDGITLLNEAQNGFFWVGGFSLVAALACAVWLFVIVRRRDLWLRWSAFEFNFYSRLGLPKKFIEASRRFEESGKMIVLVGTFVATFVLLTTINTRSFLKITDLKKAQTLFAAGRSEFEAGNNQAALLDFTRSIRLDPGNISSYFLRGRTKLRLNDFRGAIADCDRVIQSNPDFNATVYDTRGRSKYHLHDYAGAIEDCGKAIKIDPEFVSAYSGRGLAELDSKNYAAALADFNHALDLNPNFSEAYFNRGFSKNGIKDFSGAIADYSKAVEINPQFSIAYFYRANAKRALKDYQGALADYDKVIALNPKSDPAISNRNITLKLMGR